MSKMSFQYIINKENFFEPEFEHQEQTGKHLKKQQSMPNFGIKNKNR